jgi:hypothetical protein
MRQERRRSAFPSAAFEWTTHSARSRRGPHAVGTVSLKSYPSSPMDQRGAAPASEEPLRETIAVYSALQSINRNDIVRCARHRIYGQLITWTIQSEASACASMTKLSSMRSHLYDDELLTPCNNIRGEKGRKERPEGSKRFNRIDVALKRDFVRH